MTRFVESKWTRWVILAAAIAVGLAITRHYGESWDERQFFKYADRALQAYGTWPRTGTIPLTGDTYDNYGPAYVMVTALVARLLEPILPWSISDLRHLFYFLTFSVGVWAFHRLGRRWLSPLAALGATLLFASQPVIWGHAFISPKDIPFMTFFVLSVVFGFEMVDSVAKAPAADKTSELPATPKLLTAAAILIGGVLLLVTPLVRGWIGGLVAAAAAGQGNILSLLARDLSTADPQVYVEKLFVAFIWGRLILLLILTTVVAWRWRRMHSALRQLAAIAPAACILGFSTSIRILGPLAALMVAAYAIRQLGQRALAVLVVYGLLALISMYVTWPYLWPDPLGHLLESILVMSRYPWRGSVLFNGMLYPSTALPTAYLPVLLAIQFTETAWPLILLGIGFGIHGWKTENRARGGLLLLALVWSFVPLVGFILTRAPLYDNFRQVLFVLPPLFILAGLAFDQLQYPPLKVAIIALAIVPGIAAGLQLHPYEYIYYNRFVGGVQGAFRRYELDYWGTSYRAAAAYLDQTAPANATVWVEGPTHLLQEYTRPDLKIYSTYETARADHYDYVVALTRFNLDLQSYPDATVDHTIERQGALLTVIKKP